MDNERPIEKLLRDYAKKRRTEAGEPREIHPATRRMLQGEVARQFPKVKSRGFSFGDIFALWRPGLVYGICALVVIAVSVSLLLPTLRKGSPGSQLAKVRPEEESADKNLQVTAPTLSAASPVREADEKLLTRRTEGSKEVGQNALAFADAEQAKDDARGLRRDLEKEKSEAAPPRTPEGLVRSAPGSPRPAPQIASLEQSPKPGLEAQGRIESSPQNSPRVVAERPSASGAAIPLAARSAGVTPTPLAVPMAASPEPTAFSQRYGIPASASAAVVQKSQTVSTANFRRSTSVAADNPRVLTTFQFEQAGDQLRVIDGDGSTYSGTITLPAMSAYNEPKIELKGGPATKVGDTAVAKALSTPATVKYQAGQNYFFRVTGTNRTLKQPVVFTGNLLILTNSLASTQSVAAQTPVGRSQNQLPVIQSQVPTLLNATLSGKVQLGTNKELQIYAMPVLP